MMGSFSALVILVASAAQTPDPMHEPLCSKAWYRSIKEKVITSDGQGHGPDIGTDEWQSVIEFKLGVRGTPNIPPRESELWCQYIDHLVQQRDSTVDSDKHPAVSVRARGPSYNCDEARPGSIEAIICSDVELSSLDRKLAEIYAKASRKASNEHPPQLKAEQRGWIKGRDECWKSADKYECIHAEYIHRIAKLQARYRLVPGNGPVRYACDGNPDNEVIVTFYRTNPPTLIAEHGESASLMYIQPGGSGTKYTGRNEMFWEHQGETIIRWGFGAAEMRCKRIP